MTPDDQISELEEQAYAADRREQQRQAAFLYEQARRLAIDDGQAARAFSIGVRTAECWSNAADHRRALTVLLELLYDIPGTADPWDVYQAKYLNFWYQLYDKENPDLDELTACAEELDGLCTALGQPDSGDIPYRAAELLHEQGRWAEALTQFEIAWSRQPARGPDSGFVASKAAAAALRLARRADAQRWLTHITSDDRPDDARIRAAYVRLAIALYDNNAPAARAALLGVDDAMQGVERPHYSAQLTRMVVAALVLDETFGDPLALSHPAGQRLAEFPESQLSIPWFASFWHSCTMIHQIAGLRYAAGVKPVDDIFYRKPHKLRPRSAAWFHEDLPGRVTAARRACDDATPVAVLLDNSFRCSYRQQEINAMRGRIDEIAAVHNI